MLNFLIAILDFPSEISSAIVFPMAKLSKMPFFPAPVDIQALSKLGILPIIGRSSSVTGRRHAVCFSIFAPAMSGITSMAFLSKSILASVVM